MKPFGTPITTTRMDLECFVWEGPEGLNVNFVYNTDLFDAPTIERLSCHFQRMLHEIVRDPAQRLSQISLLTGEERQHQLVEWNTTQTEYPREAAIAELFDAQVAQTPEAVAVVCGENTLTYTELDTRANLLAHYLQQQGVGPEVCVGLCVERSLETVVGVLGILKAGGAYVPLDPSLPPGRVAFMLEDAGITMVLTQASLRSILPEFTGTVLALDAEWDTMAQMPVTTVVSGVTAKNLAVSSLSTGVGAGSVGTQSATDRDAVVG